MRILIVEDDELVATALTNVLGDQNYAVEVARDGQTGLDLVESFPYDLVLLDVMLPKLDGISVCQRLRSQGYQMPILLLTGKDSSHDKAKGLDAGADDYVVKPFEPEELVARVRALLRRGSAIALPILECSNLRLDPTTHEASFSDHPLQLTPKEYALLELFLRNSRRVFSCNAILEHLWSYEETPSEEAVRTHIKGLRQKLKAAGASNDLIETVYGIGYRLKPTDEKNESASSSEVGAATKQRTQAAIAGVWHRFKGKINDQVAVLEQAVAALRKNELEPERRSLAEREAHTLAGSLGTFGLPKGSQLARKIEQILNTGQLGHKETVQLSRLVKALRKEIEPSLLETAPEPATIKDERPLLLIADSDRDLTEQLVTEAAQWEIRVEIVSNLSTARDKIYREHPNVVLLDLNLSRDRQEGLALLAELSQQTPPVPVVVFNDENGLTHRGRESTLQERLEVARLGGRAFLQKPVPPAQVLEAVNHVLKRADTGAARVMAVDDDAQVLATLRTLLQPWGLKVTTLDDPCRFWETLETALPDLLILDIKMPHVSGIELCQVVRNDGRWSGLPILFLTAYTDTDIINQVFAVGADDYVSKPIVGPELVTRIVNRLERIKLLRSLAEIDPLTRVSNRYKSTQDLNRFFGLAKRYNQPLCLAILDLDHFKRVNDRYTHATGDSVLRQFGQMLLRTFRGEDVVARWGGEEFMVAMYGMTKREGTQRLSKLLETLHQNNFTAPDQTEFQISFSAGVAQFPEDGTDLQSLYRSADAALYQAKLAGRDRVMANNC